MAGEFVRVTFDAGPLLSVTEINEELPTAIDGNTTGLGENARTVLPVPVKFTLMGLPLGTVKGINNCAERAPAALGVKATSTKLRTHCPPNAAIVPQAGAP